MVFFGCVYKYGRRKGYHSHRQQKYNEINFPKIISFHSANIAKEISYNNKPFTMLD